MDGYNGNDNGDGYGNDDIYGNDDGYGEGERTEDFFSQSNSYSPTGNYSFCPDVVNPFLGLSSFTVPRMRIAALDLNASEQWPRM